MLLFPAGAIALLVVGVGFLSDGLRRMLLPGGVTRVRRHRMNKQTGSAEPPVLDVQNLSVTYDTEKGPLHTVRNVSMQHRGRGDLRPGGRVRLG